MQVARGNGAYYAYLREYFSQLPLDKELGLPAWW